VAKARSRKASSGFRPLAPLLERLGPEVGQLVLTVYGGLAGFFCYFAMYAFRKPFKAGLFHERQYFAGTQVKFKTALVLAQLLGYMTSKFFGVKYVAEAKNKNVAMHLLFIIAFAQFTLVLYAILPWDWKVLAMFLNGLHLGVIWGLVVTFLEGRRTSTYMLCGLCCAFIVSSGAVKDVALMILNRGVSEEWMPAYVAGIFLPLFVLCVWLLYNMPPPSKEDIAAQSERKAMDGTDRCNYFQTQRLGLVMLWLGVLILTAYRDYRDTFQTELFVALQNREPDPGTFSKSESIVGIAILTCSSWPWIQGFCSRWAWCHSEQRSLQQGVDRLSSAGFRCHVRIIRAAVGKARCGRLRLHDPHRPWKLH